MIIIHAAAAPDSSLFLWGEVPLDTPSGNAAKLPLDTRRSPFDPDQAQLQKALQQAEWPLGQDLAGHQIGVNLPTFEGRPSASCSLIYPAENAPEPPGEWQKWLVTGYSISVASLVGYLLPRSPSERMLSHGIMAGDDLLFWRSVAAFAAGLVVRQRFLPGLVERRGQWLAVWEPVVAGDDLERLSRIVKAAPGTCFSFLSADHGQETFSTIYQFVAMAVDYLVRSGADNGSRLAALPGSGETVHDAWMHALHSDHGRMTVAAAEVRQLQSDLARWKRMLNTTINAPFRLCFRLEEPAALTAEQEETASVVALRLSEDLAVDERPWRITYLLQSSIDPSLYVEAAAVWDESPQSAIIARTASSGRECLLASLGAASMIYLPVETSLLSARPSSVNIPVDEAYRFLTEKAGLLHEAGFGVMLPAWWTQPSGRRRLRASARTKGSQLKTSDGRMSLNALVDFRWDMALGDHTISRDELEELARLKVPLIRLRGQWVEISPEQLQAAIKFLKKNKESLSLRELLQLNLGATELPQGIDFGGVTGGGVAGELLRQFDGSSVKFDQLPQPLAFSGQLRPYQLRGYSWMNFLARWGLGACLADDMGLGKTVQTLALIASDWEKTDNESRRPVLLICPMSVVGNWQREAQRFTPQLPVAIHHGAGRKKQQSFVAEANKQAIVISSYSLLSKDIEFLKQVCWRGIVIDEAQFIKNPSTNQAQAARSLDADFKLALTGTPVENNVGDLWSIMEFLNPGFLGTQAQFKRNFLLPIQSDQHEETVCKLKSIVGPFILRRLKTDKTIISELPEKLEMKVFCNLTAEQASLYRGVLKEMELQLASAEGIGRRGLVLACMSRLKQVCNHPAQFMHDAAARLSGRSGKLQRLTEMLDEALQGDDCSLVFTQFAQMGELIKDHLQDTFGEEVLFLHGGVSQERRESMVKRFQSAGAPLFILSLKAGGVGLNLTRANQVFHFDRWWNPAVENQATDRAFRIGQTKNVQVHKFVCLGTLEEKIDQLIEAKQELAQNIVGTGEGWLTELSNEQLRQVFALGKEAVSE